MGAARRQIPAIHILDDLIRRGNVAYAQRELRAIVRGGVPRPHACDLAWIAWRTGMPAIGVKLLNPIVRPTHRKPSVATDREKAIYAACLDHIGAGYEASELLSSLDGSGLPDVLLFRAAALVSQWDYAAAAPLFAKYIEQEPDEYRRLVGRVNLAAAYVRAREGRRAESLLVDIRELTHARGLHRLHGNALELSAQNAIANAKAWDEARRFLSLAERHLRMAGAPDALYVRKWQLAVDLFEYGPSPSSLAMLAQLRREATAARYYEVIRECDLFRAIATADEKLLTHVYYGTSYEDYRERMLGDFGKPVTIPAHYAWQVHSGRRATAELDLLEGTGRGSKRPVDIKVGGYSHRLLVALSTDFYKPFRLPTLHSILYPGEYYNPVSSPIRVYEVIKRVKRWCSASGVPLAIRHVDGFYDLVAEKPYALRLTRQAGSGEKESWLLHRLSMRWPAETFTIGQVSALLDMPVRSARRVLEYGVKEKKLLRLGKGPSTRYRFPSAETDV